MQSYKLRSITQQAAQSLSPWQDEQHNQKHSATNRASKRILEKTCADFPLTCKSHLLKEVQIPPAQLDTWDAEEGRGFAGNAKAAIVQLQFEPTKDKRLTELRDAAAYFVSNA